MFRLFREGGAVKFVPEFPGELAVGIFGKPGLPPRKQVGASFVKLVLTPVEGGVYYPPVPIELESRVNGIFREPLSEVHALSSRLG